MVYTLQCICGSTDFEYDAVEEVFTCNDCGEEITASDAGYELASDD